MVVNAYLLVSFFISFIIESEKNILKQSSSLEFEFILFVIWGVPVNVCGWGLVLVGSQFSGGIMLNLSLWSWPVLLLAGNIFWNNSSSSSELSNPQLEASFTTAIFSTGGLKELPKLHYYPQSQFRVH
jgi:hypothetical protein